MAAKLNAAAKLGLEMDYEGTGRKLGLGVKVLRRMALERAQQREAQARSSPVAAGGGRDPRALGAAAGHGAKKFGQAVAGPAVKAGHVLWLEVAGCFFAFFAFGFAVEAWRIRASWRGGADQPQFLAFAAFAAFFAYFSATSFLRARRRSRR